MEDQLSQLETRYDQCDQGYLNALRAGEDHMLREAAEQAARAAAEWQAEAYRRFFAERDVRGAEDRLVIGLEIVAEKAEALTDLWRDLAAAHAARH